MLTSEQIDSLFFFCEKHFVRHYDLQVELVDHLANAIEEQMDIHPQLSFEKALEIVYQAFGSTGFGRLISEKRIAAEKKGRRMFWKFFKENFRWPKILLLLLIVSLAYSLFTINVIFFRTFFISLMLGCQIVEMYSIYKFSRTISSTGKKFLTWEFSRGSGLFFVLLFVPFYLDIFDKSFPPALHTTWHVLFSSTMLAILVIITIADMQVFSRLKNKLRNDYPKVFEIAN
jgi:hypothetical protein